MKHKFIKEKVDEIPTDYEVVGAGTIRLGQNPHSICGRRVGFSFGVSWSRHGIDCCGVLPRREAKALADKIYEMLAQCENTEEQDYAIYMSNLFNNKIV